MDFAFGCLRCALCLAIFKADKNMTILPLAAAWLQGSRDPHREEMFAVLRLRLNAMRQKPELARILACGGQSNAEYGLENVGLQLLSLGDGGGRGTGIQWSLNLWAANLPEREVWNSNRRSGEPTEYVSVANPHIFQARRVLMFDRFSGYWQRHVEAAK